MVIVKIGAGLGNQMFQYAFYEHLLRYTKDAKLDLMAYEDASRRGVYGLKRIFGIDPPVATKDELKAMGAYTNTPFAGKMRLISNILYYDDCRARFFKKLLGIDLPVRIRCALDEADPKSLSIFAKAKKKILGPPEHVCNREWQAWFYSDHIYRDNTYYTGYWQNFRWFDDIRDQIKKVFTFPKLKLDKNRDVANKMAKTQSVAVHIRRGDYLSGSYLTNLGDSDYYKKAIQTIDNMLPSPYYFFFSNDPGWVRENFHMENMMVIDWNNGSDSYVDMQLMSHAKHNITSNSTFGWWGVYLNDNRDKIVIGPQNWVTRVDVEQMSEALLMPGWIRI